MACSLSRPSTQRLTFVIVKQQSTGRYYFRSLHASSSLENFRRENFRKVSVVTKITKILYYENLEPYGISRLTVVSRGAKKKQAYAMNQ